VSRGDRRVAVMQTVMRLRGAFPHQQGALRVTSQTALGRGPERNPIWPFSYLQSGRGPGIRTRGLTVPNRIGGLPDGLVYSRQDKRLNT
jgi:hypothetical protein